MPMEPPTLYYVMDPMCSWCWGFRPVLAGVLELLPAETRLRHVMGGLAADTDEPMPADTRAYVQSMWRAVAARCGAEFNPDFWLRCRPRRSTWPACRAVLATGLQDPDRVPAMIHAIQKAYYLQARNPSERETLIELAAELGLDPGRFARPPSGPAGGPGRATRPGRWRPRRCRRGSAAAPRSCG